MSKLGWILAAVLALTLAGADDTWAQRHGHAGRHRSDGWIRIGPNVFDLDGADVFRDRRGRLVIVLDDDLFRSRGRRGRGPAFCRSGAGHPVHGRQWCTRKGFGLGRDFTIDTRRRGRTRQGDIIIGRDGEIVIRTGRR
jgi:hypothetical protein